MDPPGLHKDLQPTIKTEASKIPGVSRPSQGRAIQPAYLTNLLLRPLNHSLWRGVHPCTLAPLHP